MANAIDFLGTTFLDGGATLLARVEQDGVLIQQADIASIAYTIHALDADQNRTAVTGHEAVTVAVGEAVFDALQTDDMWTADASGYNLRIVVDGSINPPWPTAGVTYLVVATITPHVGQPFVVRWRPTAR